MAGGVGVGEGIVREFGIDIAVFKMDNQGLPWWSSGKESAFQCRGRGFDPWLGN